MQTHQVSVEETRRVVVKRFTACDRGEPAREWRALRLLAEHAPGLAPEPLRADLDASPPLIEMSLLPGVPLGGQPLTAAQQRGVVLALSQLWTAVPASRLGRVDGERGNPEQLLQEVTKLAASDQDMGGDPVVRCAFGAGREWLAAAVAPGGVLSASASPPAPEQVLGQGDSNLANFLWDGERVRLVDFEDSGSSDRAFELAVLVEHLSAWLEAGLDEAQFLGAFDLARGEQARLAECRRLAGLAWLLFLRPGGSASRRNPPGTLLRQADRLLDLLAAD